MHKERILDLIDALDNSCYKAGQVYIRTCYNGDYYHCAQGVACDLYREQTGRGEWQPASSLPLKIYEFRTSVRDKFNPLTMPDSVRRWYGLSPAQIEIIVHYNDTGVARGSGYRDVIAYLHTLVD